MFALVLIPSCANNYLPLGFFVLSRKNIAVKVIVEPELPHNIRCINGIGAIKIVG